MPTKKKDPAPRKKQEKTKPGTKTTKTAVAKKSSPNRKGFPIVGIGSSAYQCTKIQREDGPFEHTLLTIEGVG